MKIRRGFTLIELMVCIAVVLILGCILYPVVRATRGSNSSAGSASKEWIRVIQVNSINHTTYPVTIERANGTREVAYAANSSIYAQLDSNTEYLVDIEHKWLGNISTITVVYESRRVLKTARL